MQKRQLLTTKDTKGVKMEFALPVQYKGIRLDCGYRVDVPVQDKLILN